MKLVSTLFALLNLVMLSCSNGGGGSSSSNLNAGNEMNGTWFRECEDMTQTTYHFEGDNWEREDSEFASKTCTTKLSTIVTGGTFFMGESSESVSGAKKIVLTVLRQSRVVHTDGMADHDTAEHACGNDTWEKNVPHDVLGGSRCFSGYRAYAGAELYDLVKVSGDEITFGENGYLVTNTEDVRPYRLSLIPFKRQGSSIPQIPDLSR